MALTLTPDPTARVARLVVREGIGSTVAVGRTNRLDGRTRIVAVRCRDGWRPAPRGLRLTADAVLGLRAEQTVELLVRRGLRYGRLPLAWVRLHRS